MQNPVSPAKPGILASPQERARAVQAVLDKDGQEVNLVDYAMACEALAWADASTAWFVNQSNVSMATSAASMPHEAAAKMFEGPYAGLAWGARHNNSKA